MLREPCDALLIDLDGVVRVFDPDHIADVERRHGLSEGQLREIAFEPDRLRLAVLGTVSHQEWMDGVAASLAGEVGESAAQAAVAEWSRYRGRVQPEVLEFVAELRTAGVPVGLASNATDRLDADLTALGLTDAFDVVVNSAVIGHCKPSREYFLAACEALGVTPGSCMFVDDDDRNVRGARVAGLSAYRHTGVTDLRYVRAALRVPA
ncbi:MAG: HAD family hydrolase [Micromonosporaceae bacterium]